MKTYKQVRIIMISVIESRDSETLVLSQKREHGRVNRHFGQSKTLVYHRKENMVV